MNGINNLGVALGLPVLRSFQASAMEKSPMTHPAYEVRDGVRQIGSTEFRIHTWFDHTRNTMVVEVLTAEDAAKRESRGHKAAASH